ncbi:MAG: serine hydrolase, partial [Arcobacter sp.]|nr:serine hydrolase [Arcobacter sp.]
NFDIEITTENGKLFTQATGQPKFEVFPETTTVFYLKVVQAKVEFFKESDSVNKIILYQNGKEMPGKRIEKEK